MSAFCCIPSFANLSQWIHSIEEEGNGYEVKYKADSNKTDRKNRANSYEEDRGAVFDKILELDWNALRPHYDSHFANGDGALLEPIRNNTPNNAFPLTTGTKPLHTAFKVSDGDIDKFIKDDILGNISSVAVPIKDHNEFKYKVTLSAAKPWYKCEKGKSVLKWPTGSVTHHSDDQIRQLNDNGFVRPNNAHVDHNVTCDAVNNTKNVVITANDNNQVTSIYPTD